MKILIIIATILTVLTACSSDDSTTTSNNTVDNGSGPIDATVFADALIGTWKTACESDPPGSVQISVSFDGTNSDLSINGYSDTNCQDTAIIIPTSFTYSVGGTTTLDGSVASLTSGNIVDFVLKSPGATTLYFVVAITGNTLYLGDDDIDPQKDGSSPEKRPVTLDDSAYIKE